MKDKDLFKKFEKLTKDNNIEWYKRNNSANVEVVSYDKVLCDEKTYVKKVFKDICDCISLIKEDLDCEVFTIRISDYCIDGLYESNSELIKRNSSIVCLY